MQIPEIEARTLVWPLLTNRGKAARA